MAPNPETDYRISETQAGSSRGWHYTPLAGKRPTLKNWPTRELTEAETLAYAQRGNVGLVTGDRSGVTVIDLDGDAAARIAEFPPTPTVITGGAAAGRQLYYRHDPESPLRNWVGEIGEHIDIRTTGGQVVAVGSLHPETGAMYDWQPGRSPADIELAPFPTDLVLRLYEEEQERKAKDASPSAADTPALGTPSEPATATPDTPKTPLTET